MGSKISSKALRGSQARMSIDLKSRYIEVLEKKHLLKENSVQHKDEKNFEN